MNLATYWKSRQAMVEKALDRHLPKKSTRPVTIHEAMRYSIFAGGKRLRPILTLASAEVLGAEPAAALPLACAVECIHTYSLIHDDLPSMDNDDFRRGKPTSHKVYGEGMAILAGDALLTIAFEMAAKVPAWPRYSHADLITEIASASGSQGLIAGQVADLEGEKKKVLLEELRYIHLNKTAALITSSLRLGAMSANATTAQLKSINTFGNALGLAFQVVDDILDITQTTEQLGKSAGKDVKSQKSTYPALLGLEGARKEADKLTRQAVSALKPLGSKAQTLLDIADYMLQRQS
jgi:geranylgeranyl diphosphate synthase, type II